MKSRIRSAERSADFRAEKTANVAAPKAEPLENTAIELLLAEFNEGLRCEGKPHFEILERCPQGDRRELLSLMNVAALAYRALEPERQALKEGPRRIDVAS